MAFLQSPECCVHTDICHVLASDVEVIYVGLPTKLLVPQEQEGKEMAEGEGNGNPLQYSCLEKNTGAWRSLVDYRPWGRKESDTTERLRFFTSQGQEAFLLSAFVFFVSCLMCKRISTDKCSVNQLIDSLWPNSRDWEEDLFLSVLVLQESSLSLNICGVERKSLEYWGWTYSC